MKIIIFMLLLTSPMVHVCKKTGKQPQLTQMLGQSHRVKSNCIVLPVIHSELQKFNLFILVNAYLRKKCLTRDVHSGFFEY